MRDLVAKLTNPMTFMKEHCLILCPGDGAFACDVKPATIEQHLLIKTRSTEYRKIKQKMA